MFYGDFKDLAKRTALDKVLKNKAFKIASNPKYDGYQRRLASYKFFDKMTSGGAIKSMLNQQQFINQLLKNLKEEKYIHHLKTIFGVLIYLICNY